MAKTITTIAQAGDGYSSTNYIDHYRRQRKPYDIDLIEQFKRVVFACANINANAMAQVPLRLYVKTSAGEKSPRIRTKSVDRRTKDRLSSNASLQFFLKEFKEVEEVTEHPLKTLLQKANSSPYLNGYIGMIWTVLYQEVTGKAYWYLVEDTLGRPVEYWILPVQYLTPKRLYGSKKFVDYYEFKVGMSEVRYDPSEIVQFLYPNLLNPYIDGYGPTEAAYEAVLVSNKLISHESNMLDNQGRPDAILSPGKDVVLGADEAETWEKKFNAKFQRGGGGKLMVAEETVTLSPLSYPPKDLAALEIHNWGKTEICNAHDIPIALLEAENINRATLEAAMEQHAIYGVRPRCDRYVAQLNDQIVSRYDPSGRLFFAFDDPVPKNRELVMQENVQYVLNRILTPNEVRYEIGYPPIAGGEKLQSINDGAGERENKRQSGEAEK